MESHQVGTGNSWICRAWISRVTSCSCSLKRPLCSLADASWPQGSSSAWTTHLKPLGDTLGDADGELGYLGRTCFSFFAIRFIFSLSFHHDLSQETERYMVSGKPDVFRHICPEQVGLLNCQVQRYPPFLQAVRTTFTENSPCRCFQRHCLFMVLLAAPGKIQNWGTER